MKTLTRTELDAPALRYTALLGISMRITSASLRSRTPQEPADKQVADEIDFLTASGFTRQVASTVLAERDHANRALRRQPCSEEEARREIRAVAEAMLRAKGPAAAGMSRQIADTAGDEGDYVMRRSFLEFAAAAELLLAEHGAESFA